MGGLFDTLKDPKTQKFSQKRLASFTAFWVAVIYAFSPLFTSVVNCLFGCNVQFEVLEFVFWGFITYSGTAIGMTVWNKKIDKPKNTENES